LDEQFAPRRRRWPPRQPRAAAPRPTSRRVSIGTHERSRAPGRFPRSGEDHADRRRRRGKDVLAVVDHHKRPPVRQHVGDGVDQRLVPTRKDFPAWSRIAGITDEGSPTEASPTTQTPSGNSPASPAPTSRAKPRFGRPRPPPTEGYQPVRPHEIGDRDDQPRHGRRRTSTAQADSRSRGSTVRNAGKSEGRPSPISWYNRHAAPEVTQAVLPERAQAAIPAHPRSRSSVVSETTTCPPCAIEVRRAAARSDIGNRRSRSRPSLAFGRCAGPTCTPTPIRSGSPSSSRCSSTAAVAASTAVANRRGPSRPHHSQKTKPSCRVTRVSDSDVEPLRPPPRSRPAPRPTVHWPCRRP